MLLGCSIIEKNKHSFNGMIVTPTGLPCKFFEHDSAHSALLCPLFVLMGCVLGVQYLFALIQRRRKKSAGVHWQLTRRVHDCCALAHITCFASYNMMNLYFSLLYCSFVSIAFGVYIGVLLHRRSLNIYIFVCPYESSRIYHAISGVWIERKKTVFCALSSNCLFACLGPQPSR